MSGQTKARGCGNKKQHDTRASAEDQIRRLQNRFGSVQGEYRAYDCPHCDYWHVGHRGRRQRQGYRR